MGRMKDLQMATNEKEESIDQLSYLVFQIRSRLDVLLLEHDIPPELQQKIKTLSFELMSISGLESRQKL